MLRNRSGFNRVSNLRNRPSFRRATRNRKADYNGYKNWPTWYLKIILIDDEDPENLVELARTALEENKDYPSYYLEKLLKERAEDIIFDLDNVDRSSLAGELADYALEQVDFSELAEIAMDVAKDEGLED